MSKFPTMVLLALGAASFALSGCQGEDRDGAAKGSSSTIQERRETAGVGTTDKECKPDSPTDSITVDPDGSYDKVLVRRADNVFVGRVIEKSGEKPPGEAGPLPSTSFAVGVERNVKGSLSGTVTVDQAGGCDPRYGRVVLINEDPLLRPGERAVFSTEKYPRTTGSHYIVGGRYGDMRVDTQAEEDEIVARLRDGKREYVPFGPSRRQDR